MMVYDEMIRPNPGVAYRTRQYLGFEQTAVGGTRDPIATVRSRTMQAYHKAVATLSAVEPLIAAITRALATEFADLCVIDLPSLPAQSRRHAIHSRAGTVDGPTFDQFRQTVAAANARPPFVDMVFQKNILVWGNTRAAGPDNCLWETDKQRELGQALGLSSVLVLPLTLEEQTYGIMGLLCVGEHHFQEDDVAFARYIAEHVSGQIHTSLLYEEAMHAAEARERYLNFVAHDLRTPLTAASLSVDLAQRKTSALREEHTGLQRDLARARLALDETSRLVESLVDMARAKNGSLTLQSQVLSARGILEEAFELLAPLAQRRQINLQRLTPVDPPLFKGDRNAVLRVLINLTTNAIKFTPSGGTVSLSIRTDTGAKSVFVSISDTGEGIASHALPHIFEPFWQAETSMGRGAGLGLPICKSLVEGMGGTMSVTSVAGRGSDFSFSLPLALREDARLETKSG